MYDVMKKTLSMRASVTEHLKIRGRIYRLFR